jgi:lysozyme
MEEFTLGADFSFWNDLWDSAKRLRVLTFFNFQKAAEQGIKFAILKSTTGLTGKDSTYDTHLRDAKVAQLVTGAYHWYLPGLDPVMQAEWAVRGTGETDLPLFVDVEEKKFAAVKAGQMWPALSRMLLRVEVLTHRQPIIYTNWDYWTTMMADARDSDGWRLWIAGYRTGAPLVPLPWHPRQWSFWQYTDRAVAQRYGGPVGAGRALDMDLFAGSLDELRAL